MYGGYPGAQPAEVSSLKSLLHIGGIISLVIGILTLLAAIGEFVVAAVAAAFGFAIFLIFPIFLLLAFVVDLLIYLRMKEINRMIDAGQYEAAKNKTLLWMILGFIFGWLVVGIIILVAWLKFDPVINWQRQMQAGGGMPPAAPTWGAPAAAPPPGGSPPMAPMAAPTAAPAAAAPVPPAAGTCPRCGKPATWVAQYNRWYCYSCQQYV